MIRRVLFLLVSLLAAALFVPEVLLAAPGNSITFISVSPTTCDSAHYLGDSIQVNFQVSVAPFDSRTDNWTISNPRTGTYRTASGSPGTGIGASGYTGTGSIWLGLPSGTTTGDSLTITVQMLSSYSNRTTATNTSSGTFNCSTGTFTSASKARLLLNFTDGRINQEPQQSLTIYPNQFGGYDIYAVNAGVGSFALRVTKAQLAANPDRGQNYLIAQNMGVQLYRLAGGALQAQRPMPDGKLYVFIWTPNTSH